MPKTQTASQIRESFLSYFDKQGHTRVPSSRLIPDGDPTILFTNAGMNQFKNLFLGIETRNYNRAATSQKCVRAGGKHNDLENVGFTARHHTFFEMLGNFSFGDYFKKEAIHFSWEYITKELGLDKNRLYVSVFETDDEAADIWHKQEGVPKDRIYRFGEKDNFWRMGSTGPCGPCSEIFYDLGDTVPGDPKENVMGGSGDRFMEIWNLVFMQYNESEDGKLTPLPKPSVDTGMGLERITSVVQGKISNYDTDLLQNLIQVACKLTGAEYVQNTSGQKHSKEVQSKNVAMRVLADHARATAFLIADTVLPSNEGRGYVLRRIMRRAIRYGRVLSPDTSILPGVVEAVIQQMRNVYPELESQRSLILSTAKEEEKRFLSTLDQGVQILNAEFSEMEKRQQKVVDGRFVFKLYDTYGFPADLTRTIASERQFSIDEKSFETHLEAAKELARSSWKGAGLSNSDSFIIKSTQEIQKKLGVTQFVGYDATKSQGQILFLSDGKEALRTLKAEQMGLIALNQTPFYAESGGQVGDVGQIVGTNGLAEVLDTTKTNDIHLHHVRVLEGTLNLDEQVQLEVNLSKRRSTANNHSATHLLHSALRNVLGAHVTQAGSLVGPDKLRFDFTHNKPLTSDEILAVENLVNAEISGSNPVETKIMTPEAAVADGALALFGEKYGAEVRVLKMGAFSTELCGGTHVPNTSQIRFFKIVSEGGVSSGVRRIEAITGDQAAQYLFKHTRENLEAREACGLQEGWLQYLQSENRTSVWIELAKENKKNLKKELQALKSSAVDLDAILKTAIPFTKGNLSSSWVFVQLPVEERDVLTQVTEKMRSKMKSGIIIAIGQGEDGSPIIISNSKDVSTVFPAGKILNAITEVMGGRGGGRPELAQGAVKDLSLVDKAKIAVQNHLK